MIYLTILAILLPLIKAIFLLSKDNGNLNRNVLSKYRLYNIKSHEV